MKDTFFHRLPKCIVELIYKEIHRYHLSAINMFYKSFVVLHSGDRIYITSFHCYFNRRILHYDHYTLNRIARYYFFIQHCGIESCNTFIPLPKLYFYSSGKNVHYAYKELNLLPHIPTL